MAAAPANARTLPLDEFLQPAVLAAVGMTALNDHWLKTASLLPSVLTGKISDVAGMIFFPLFLTACIDTLLFAATRNASRRSAAPYRLTKAKLLLSCVLTGVLFSALQLFGPAKELYVAAHALIGIQVHVTQDPTDLIALLALPVAYRLGRPYAHPLNQTPNRFIIFCRPKRETPSSADAAV